MALTEEQRNRINRNSARHQEDSDMSDYQEFLQYKEMKRQQELQKQEAARQAELQREAEYQRQQEELRRQQEDIQRQQIELQQAQAQQQWQQQQWQQQQFAQQQNAYVNGSVPNGNVQQSSKKKNLDDLTLTQKLAGWAIFLALVLVVYIVQGRISFTGNRTNSSLDTSRTTSVTEQVQTGASDGSTSNVATGQQGNTNVGSVSHVDTKSDSKQLSLGEIGRDSSGAAVCLPYVKRSESTPTALGPTSVESGYEVILGYFEFYNDGQKEITVHPDDGVLCYADGIQVLPDETYIKVESDGVRQFNDALLLSGTKAMSVQDFVVPIGWSELKFFYGNDCVWTVTQSDVSSSAFEGSNAFPDVGFEYTPVGGSASFAKYNLTFEGVSYWEDTSGWSFSPRVVCKFMIENTSDETLDMKLTGYSNMKAYVDGYYTDDTAIFTSDNIDGYSNIVSLENIAPHMSAKVYVAFEVDSRPENILIYYDDGYVWTGNTAFIYSHVD